MIDGDTPSMICGHFKINELFDRPPNAEPIQWALSWPLPAPMVNKPRTLKGIFLPNLPANLLRRRTNEDVWPFLPGDMYRVALAIPS